MNRILSLISALLLFSTVHNAYAQQYFKNTDVTGICYASNKVNKFYIPPPKDFLRKSLTGKGATITIYYSGFSAQAISAMEYAKSILESILPADASLTIVASWEKISTSGVLAQTSITGFASGWAIDAQNPLSVYPAALAEKIAGRKLNTDQEGDIKLQVNSTMSWYLGTDGNTPTSKYDLITVVIHEICHGLGFYDSFSSDGTKASWGLGNYPMIYDTFIENFTGTKLIDTLKILNNSADLNSQVTNSQVYFNGPLLKKYSSNVGYSSQRAKLYAPPTFESGSSISHLDESATLRENSLMTPFINLGEAIHDPGKYTLSILGDIGWINTRIIHKPMGDTENHLVQIPLTTVIKSDTAYNHSGVGVVYSFNNFVTKDTIYLTPALQANTYNTIINIPSYNSSLKYFFFVDDYFHRVYRSPSYFTKIQYSVYIGTDTVKPVIIHQPVSYYLQTVDSLKFIASVTDNLGVDSVYVEYRINNGASKFITLKRGTGNSFNTVFNARSLLLKGHDSIEYKIFAVDSAQVPNIAMLPKTGFYVTHIEEISATLPGYNTDFTNAGPDFFNIGFTVSKPSGFSNYGLNSKHPYESPEDNTKDIQYTAILRHPLKFLSSGMMFSYDEIVLVEPGEAGAVFGSQGFYDYVIIEGSKNFGKSWFNLLDGYNCNLYTSWAIAYNSKIVGDNSTYVPTEAMLKKHTFLYRPSDKISAGDTMLIRFRLYSDPFANGWGWSVENLKIAPLVDAVSEVSNTNVVIYPNPGSGIIKLSTGSQYASGSKPLHYKIFNAAGICLMDKENPATSEVLADLSAFPPGMYIIILYLDDGIKTIKYSLIK
jgi:hypothetical protein